MKKYLLLTFTFFLTLYAFPQGADCPNAEPVCTDVGGYTFDAGTNTTAPAGNNYGCLGSQPNPAWYYFEISTAGNIDMNLTAGADIDFIIWGPFNNINQATAQCGGLGNGGPSGDIEDCSYSSTNNETPSITGAQVGEVYIMLVTNFANVPQTITFSQTGGSTGATDCTIVTPCAITNFTGTVGTCAAAGGTYSTTGTVTFTDPPTTGTLTVSDCDGNQQVFNAPFASPINYTITGQDPDGAACNVTAVFSDDAACTATLNYTAPTCPPCNIDNFTANIGAPAPCTDTYQTTGSVTFSNAPTTGQLIVEDCDGNQAVQNAPFTSPFNYTITNQDADGSACDITVRFTDEVACTNTLNYTAPTGGAQDETGTVTESHTGDGTNTPIPATLHYVLCDQDQFQVLDDGNFNLDDITGSTPDPTDVYNPGVGYMLYSCPPTVFGAGVDLNTDPCLVGFLDEDFSITNNGGSADGLIGFMNGHANGPLTDQTFYIVPIGVYDNTNNLYNFNCYDLATEHTMIVQYLNPITFTFTEDCQAGTATITINGGYPEFYGGNYTASNLSHGTFDNTTAAHGGTITISGLTGGDDYSFDVVDANGCPITINPAGSFPPILDAAFSYPTDVYCSTDGDPSPQGVTNPGGTYSSIQGGISLNAGNGVIDLSASAAGTYDIVYSTQPLNAVCFDTDTFTVTINLTPVVTDVLDQSECGSYTLPVLTDVDGSNNTGTLGLYTAPGGGGTQLTFGDAFTTVGTTTIYIYDETGTTPNCFDEEQFNVTITPGPVVNDVADAVVCDSYTLPLQTDVENTANTANLGLYTAPNGGGTQLNFGDAFTTAGTTTIYIFDETGTVPNCTSQEQFDVTVNLTPVVDDVTDATVCDTYTLPTQAAVGNANNTANLGLYTAPNGGGTQLNFGDAFTTAGTTTIYIFDETGTTPNCFDEEQFDVTVNLTPVVDDVADATVCDTYTLPTLADVDNANNTATLGLYTAPNGGGTQLNFGDAFTTAGTTTVFIYDETGTTPNCFDEEQFDITINLTPVVDDVADATVCDTYTLPTQADVDNANNTGTLGLYTAANGGGTQLIFGSAFTTAGTTTIFIYDETGTTPNCLDQEDFTITINESVNAGLDNGATFCNVGGTSVNLQNDLLDPGADAGGTWFETTQAPLAGHGQYNAATTELTVGGLAEGTYTFIYVVNAVAPCENDTAYFTINVTGLIDAGADNNATFCNTPGGTVDLNTMLDAGVAGGTWAQQSGPSTAGQFNATSGVFDMSDLGNGTYVFRYTIPANGACVGDDADMSITVNEVPYIDNHLDVTECDTYTLPAITGASLNGANYHTQPQSAGGGAILNVGDAITTTQTVYIYDETGTTPNCFDEDTFTVTINLTPAITDLVDQEHCDTYTLPAIAGTNLTGNEGYYTATNGGGTQLNVGDAITTSQQIFIYDETATTPNCTHEQDFQVTINVTPQVDDLLDQTHCDTYTLPVITGTDLTGNEAYYTATNGGGTQMNAGDAITTSQQIFIYDETATTPNCFTEEDFQLTINNTPAIDDLVDQEHCDNYTLPAITGTNLTGNEAYYTAANGAGTQMNAGDVLTTSQQVFIYDETTTTPNCTHEQDFQLTINITPDVQDLVDVTACNDYELEAIPGVDLTGNEAYYTLPNGGGTQYVAGDVIDATTTLYLYDETGTNPNCFDEEEMLITINNSITAGADNVAEICEEGGTVDVGALLDPNADTDANPANNWLETSASGQFDVTTQIFDVTGLNPGTYTFEYQVEGVAPCLLDVAEFTVTVNPLPNVDAGVYPTICGGAEITLYAGGADSYVWTGGVTNGVAFVPGSTQQYFVTGTDINGCENIDSAIVTIEDAPQMSFTTNTNSGCAPLEVTLTNTSTPVGTSCVWTLSTGTILTGCANVSTTITETGCHDINLEMTSSNNCVYDITYQDYICVTETPIASFTHGPGGYTVTNPEVIFNNTSQYSNTYEWSFGETGTSSEEHPTHNFPFEEPGTYEVELIATNNNIAGCADTAYATIEILDELLYHIPNTFTPDQDDFNEVFQPVFVSGFDPYSYKLLIYDRWGEILFESNDASVGWDGKYGGKLVQDGTYVWKIDFKETMSDKRHTAIGHVNVLR